MSASFSVAAVLLKLLVTVAGPELHLPDAGQLAAYQPPETTRIYAADGSLLREYYVENRVVVPLSALPPYLVQAFISAEDQHFRRHPGIDPPAWPAPWWPTSRTCGTAGGSRAARPSPSRWRELVADPGQRPAQDPRGAAGLRIEHDFSKQQILELYLNQIYLGRGAYGVARPRPAYFGKPLEELTVSEAAFLAALPKAPNNYNPMTRLEAAAPAATTCSTAWPRTAPSPPSRRPPPGPSRWRCGQGAAGDRLRHLFRRGGAPRRCANPSATTSSIGAGWRCAPAGPASAGLGRPGPAQRPARYDPTAAGAGR